MKKILIVLFVYGFISQSAAYDKLSVVERFTNCSCPPCASLNNSWYNATTASLINSGSMTHIIYNVSWPSDTDPMYLLNCADNNNRQRYYGCNGVPWIEINGSRFETSIGQSGFINVVTSGNADYAPFQIMLKPEVFSNNVIDVYAKIIRDSNDNTLFGNIKLRVALIEKEVEFYTSPGSNGELFFYSVCRKMLPDGNGSEFTIPAPGDSTEINMLYPPTEEFLKSVNIENLQVLIFIQDDDTQYIYQSTVANLIPSTRVNAAFQVEDNLGASPFIVNFSDLSTATDTTNIISWEWDFDNDGNIDSQDPAPTWTFSTEQSYTVSLTVSDGNQQHTRTINDYITVLKLSSEILVVNGLHYDTYTTEMEDFYNNSACFGNHQIDIWDLFGDQDFEYHANSNIQQVNLMDRSIPNSVLNAYHKVIWIGNRYFGDDAFYDPLQVLNYIRQGGNFLLATRHGAKFLSGELRYYCGISPRMPALSDVTQLIALDDNLINMPALENHTYVQFVQLNSGSEAIPIFDDDTNTDWIAGFRLQKDNDGAFIYIAGRPYRFDNNVSFQNYNYIIENWLNYTPASIEDETSSSILKRFQLFQNYPNPFNPITMINYQLPLASDVELSIYNLLGQKVATLVDRRQNAATYQVEWDADGFASGIYYYRIKTGEHQDIRKMVLLR